VDINNCSLINQVNDGFASSGTLNILTIENTYANGYENNGYTFSGGNYIQLRNLGADSGGGDAYHFDDAGVVNMIACGAEQNTGRSVYCNTSSTAWLTLSSCFLNPSTDTPVVLVGTVVFTVEGSAILTSTAGKYGILNTAAASSVHIINSDITAPLGPVSEYTRVVRLNNGSIEVGTFTQAKISVSSSTDNLLSLQRSGFNPFITTISSGGQLAVTAKAGAAARVNVYKINADAADAGLTFTVNGAEYTGIVLVGTDAPFTKYRLTVNSAGTLSTTVIP
jgi:hypothetical protein